jgi:hypothetical protein
MFDVPTPDLFQKLMIKTADQIPLRESQQQKVLKAFVKMKEKAARRNDRPGFLNRGSAET